MGKTIAKIGKRSHEVEMVDIFGVGYRTLTEKDREDVGVANRAKQLARQYKDMNLKDLDEDNLTEDQVDEIQTLVNDLARLVLPTIKKDVLEELTDMEKLTIIQAYFESENGRVLLVAAGVHNLPFQVIQGQKTGKVPPVDVPDFGTDDEPAWPDPASVGSM